MSPAEIPLAKTPYFELSREPGRRLLRLKRTEVQFESHEAMTASDAEIVRAMAPLDRARHVIMLDARDSPLRTDPAFEQTAEKRRVEFFQGFARVAVLVKTAVGKLQMQRFANRYENTRVFDDEAAALGFLHEKLAPAR